ncbi:BTAD domain-containing putative transcriptional regulator [Nocardioides sp.]|uniref:BTAD domain-containing putative transcriptional regulator n=1 Tax=Nocardioides sp. TaxID=35761 RepID=UPI001A19E05B|nr:BTAD domain-containing putative transcriptional regulator [Nocardioides sp.]MBJ7358850.1 winged helix-turn-helix domain-containing protein [Nocardioides sp.]
MESEPRPSAVWVGVLGPLALRVDDADVKVPGVRRRTLLATLALARGRVVGVERLVDALWPDDPPDDAAQALYNHVSRLRADLGPAGGRLTRRGAGYVLELTDDELDATVVRAAADRLADLPPEQVLADAREALDLWRGPALEEFRGHPELDVEAVALDELRLRLHDELVRARIEVGDGSAVADASAAVAADPLRERSVLLLMRALAGEGRAAEAMTAGSSYRRLLAEETGLDPGPALARLEQEIAAGGLAPHEPEAGPARRTVARPSGPLVGREHDYDEVLRLLAGHRVVTVTGPGGVGKTRLAFEVAAGLAEAHDVDVVVVDLAAVEDATRLVQAVATTIGLRLIAAEPSTPVEVATALADTPLLLLLDNAEHVAEACRDLVDAIDRHAPAVRVLVTSRVTLHAASEYVIRLQPLPTPRDAGDLAALERQPSVQAFLEHARRRDRGFELTAIDAAPLVEILQHLDGLPLAIELVAGQVAMLPLVAVRDRLSRSLDLATVGEGHEDDRQRTLRLTIRWSYDRLTSAQQMLLRAVAAYPGGVDLVTVEELADEVAPGYDPMRLLHGLVDASLLDVDPGRARYRLLFTVRAFLIEEVEALGESADAEDRFLRWAVRAAEEIGAGLYSTAEALADRRLRAELDNLRAARDLARSRGLLDERVEITLAVDEPALWRDLREIWSWCLELATSPEIAGHPREVELLGAGAEAARQAGDYERAVALATRGLEMGRATGTSTARCWSALAAVAHYRGDFAAAARDWQRSARSVGPSAAGLLASAALAAAYGGDRAGAETILAEARTHVQVHPIGSNRAFVTYVEGELAAADSADLALARYTAAVEEARSVGATFVAGVAEVARATLQGRIGDRATAAAAYSRLLDAWRTSGHGPQLWTTARNAATLLVDQGYPREAALLLLRADATPDAAAVDQEIARHSGRSFVPVETVVAADELEALRAQVATMTTTDVVELARTALSRIAAG